MKEEGIKIPAQIPVNLVEAKNIKEAKLKLLSLTSNYGNVSTDGLKEFMKEADIGLDEIDNFNFSDINLEKFKIGFKDSLLPADLESDLGEGDYNKNDILVFYFDKIKDMEKVQKHFGVKIKTIDGKELIKKLGIK